MRYSYASENIIMCDDFLPPHILQNIKSDLHRNINSFGEPEWSGINKATQKLERFSTYNKNCGGYDYWINFGESPESNKNILDLESRFYHQGFFTFLESQGRDNVFKFLKKNKTHAIHVVSYNNNGYYDWHADTQFFTFNLIINESDELSGGDMLFMDEGRTIEISSRNNLMVVFPSYIHHAITPIRSKSGKDVPFTQQRFSIQYWVKCG